jgi:hypothetical protein
VLYALAALVALVVFSPSTAVAETAITAQAVADDGSFLSYAAAPAQPTGLCLVDTGVNENPDTEGVVVERTALDGGSGGDVSPTLHGTVLAMMAAAPANGWGMVGTAPRAVQVVSVRILEPGQTTFPFSAYAAGITECLEVRHKYNIRVINLSLGSPETPSAEAIEFVGNAVERATNYGLAVVAAAGNDDGGAVAYPAAYWQGTSEASAIAASSLAALDAYQPDLSAEAGEKALTEADDGALDIAQAFRNAGLAGVVSAGEAAEPGAPQSSTAESSRTPVAPLTGMKLTRPFARPQAHLKRVKHRLVLSVTGLPHEAEVQVRYLGTRQRSRHLRVVRALHGVFTKLTLPTSGIVAVSVRYTDPYDVERASPWTTLRLAPSPSNPSHVRHTR